MKTLLLTFGFFFAFLLQPLKSAAQEDYSTIHFLASKMDKAYQKYFEGAIYKLYLNDRLVTSVQIYEHLKFKMYSQGRMVLTMVNGSNPSTMTLEIVNGRDYYVINSMSATSMKNNYFRLIDSAEWKVFEPSIKKVVEEEEDKESPYGKLDNSKRTGKGQGTCFAISPSGYLITNYHCVENAKEVTVKGIDGDFTTKYGATVVASDPSNDLALLKIGNKNVKFETPVFGLRSSGVNQAEKVYALGFPAATAMGQEVKITEGIISSKSGAQGDVSKFQISAAVNHGNSGGPLIDEQGNLIGVIFAKSTIAESAGYAIKAGYLETFLKNVDGFEYPAFVNTIKDKSLTEKVAGWKSEIFIVESN